MEGCSDDRVWRRIAFFALVFALFSSQVLSASLVDPSSSGFGGQTRDQNYDALLDALFSNPNVVTSIGDKMWVPWFDSSSSCQISNLHSGGSCNSGQTIDFTHNCMVTDEFSQVGVLVAMGRDQARMDQFYNTVIATKSTNGKIPAWRVYRDGDVVQACRSGINGNCDTASDATARIIIALFAGGDNALFADQGKKNAYKQMARDLSQDFVNYEVDKNCRPSSLGWGDICYWMAAGSNAKRGGLASTDYAYTGYYADGIIAMLQACAQTGDMLYCRVAGNFTLNYLQASYPQGTSMNTFRVPPGRSFKWDTSAGVPKAMCTNTCNPDVWDGADAPRALGMCQANYYAKEIGVSLPGLDQYCKMWGEKYMNNANSAPVQYLTDGTARSSQSGYFAQGLQALFQMGGHNPALFSSTITNALNHYSPTKKTWDNAACFGIYNQAFAIRALGVGIGRDLASFPKIGTGTPVAPTPVFADISFTSTSPSGSSIAIAEPANQTVSFALSNPDGLSTTTTWLLNGVTQPGTGSSYQFIGGYSSSGTHTITARVQSTKNTIERSWTITVSDTPVPEIPVVPLPQTDISFSSTSPSGATLTISEPSSQSFSIGVANPSDLSTTITWFLDGVSQGVGSASYQFPGGYTAQGTYNISVRVQSSKNTIQKSWSLTVQDTPQAPPVNDTVPLPAVPGIFFVSSSPASASLSIMEPQDQTFSFALGGNEGIGTSAKWYVDGVLQTGKWANSQTFVYTGSYSSAGDHTVSAVVTSSKGTIQRDWTLHVSDVAQTVTPQNIAIASSSPATTTSLFEPNSQTFQFSLNNPSALATTTTWSINGVVVAGASGSSFTLPGNDSAQGVYSVTAKVSSSRNTVTKTWVLTVKDVPPSPSVESPSPIVIPSPPANVSPPVPSPPVNASPPANNGKNDGVIVNPTLPSSARGNGGSGGGGGSFADDPSITDEPTKDWRGPALVDPPKAPAHTDAPAPVQRSLGTNNGGSGGGGSERLTKDQIQGLIAGYYEREKTVDSLTVVARLREYFAQGEDS